MCSVVISILSTRRETLRTSPLNRKIYKKLTSCGMVWTSVMKMRSRRRPRRKDPPGPFSPHLQPQVILAAFKSKSKLLQEGKSFSYTTDHLGPWHDPFPPFTPNPDLGDCCTTQESVTQIPDVKIFYFNEGWILMSGSGCEFIPAHYLTIKDWLFWNVMWSR
jgi:hypothetical protein